MFSQLSYKTEDNLPRSGTDHSGLPLSNQPVFQFLTHITVGQSVLGNPS